VAETEGHYSDDRSFTGWALATGTGTPLTFTDEAARQEFLKCIAEAEVVRLRAENTAMAAALEDIAGMRELPDGTWVADAECMMMRGRCWEYLGKPDGGPEEWCHTCVAEVAWCAWRMGVLR